MLGAQPLAREAGKTEIHLISFISILRVFICHAKFGETYLEVCCCDAAFRVSINLQRSGAITIIRFMSWSTSKFCNCFWVIFAVRKWKPFSLEVRSVISFLYIFIAWKVTQFDTVMVIKSFLASYLARSQYLHSRRTVRAGSLWKWPQSRRTLL